MIHAVPDGDKLKAICAPTVAKLDRILNLGCSALFAAAEQLVSFTGVKLGRFILGHTEEASPKGPPLLYARQDSNL